LRYIALNVGIGVNDEFEGMWKEQSWWILKGSYGGKLRLKVTSFWTLYKV